MVLPVGALTTVMPARVAASRSTLSTPTPGPPDDDEAGPGGDQLRIDLDLAAHDQGVVLGQDRAQLLAGQADPLVDLVMRPQPLETLLGDRLGDEDLHALTPTAAGAMPIVSSAARCAAATAIPGSTCRPWAIDTISRVLIAPRISSSVTEPRWPSRKIFPGELALAAGEDQAASLELRVERLPVEAVRDQRRGHRLRGVARIGEELEAQRGEPGARCGGADLVAGEDVLLALGPHEPQALVDLEDDRDRRRERRLAVCRGVAMRPQVEVEARHRRRLHRGPAARGGGDHRQTRCGHPGLLRAGDDHVDAPRVHLERDGAETGHAVDEDQRVGRLLADGCGEFGDRVHDPGRRLVVGEQDRLGVGHAAQPLADLRTVRRVAPFGVELRHVRAVDAGDLGEPVAERADAHAEDPVAGRQRVDDRRLEPAGPRGRDHRHVGRRPEVGLHAVEDPGEHRRELGTPVVDHLPRTRLADAGWQRGGARDAQVRLEAGHGTLLVAEQGRAHARTT